jgi:hypothetical protein
MASIGHVELDDATVERLARRIHERYVTRFNADGPSWVELADERRDANRAQARDMVAKLRAIGARVESGPQETPFTFSDAELERLAEHEHERWMAQRIGAGWRFGRRDDARLRHPMIKPWHKLGRIEREKDRAAVRQIPDLLISEGLRIIRAR